MKNVALVAGASGIIGSAVSEALIEDKNWKVRGLRRTAVEGVEPVDADLTNPESTAAALQRAADTTHVFYAALRPSPDAQEESDINTSMLENLLDGLESAGAKLKRVVLYQGAKVYGPHLGGPVQTPFYEGETRHLAANFYFSMQDLLAAKADLRGYEWSILRPDAVFGDVAEKSMNLALVIGAYAALCRDAGIPLRFPGSMQRYRHLFSQATDGPWLGRASIWAALAPAAKNEAFNLVGEPFRWEHLWKQLAEALGMEVGEPQPLSLAKYMPSKKPVWDKLVEKHGLTKTAFEGLIHWGFGDFVLDLSQDMVSSMEKIRSAGFNEPMDNTASLVGAINRLREKRILP